MPFLSRVLVLTAAVVSLQSWSVSSYAVAPRHFVGTNTNRKSTSRSHVPSKSSRQQSAVPSENFISTVVSSHKETKDYGDCVSWDWKKVASSAFQKDKRPIILFDGQCNLCSASVNYCLDHDPDAHFRYVSLQSKVGQSLLIRNGRHPQDMSTIVLCTHDGTAHVESDAVCKIAQGLGGNLLPSLGWVGEKFPKFLRDPIYHFVAENRFRFGRHEGSECRLDFDGTFNGRFLDDPEV